MTRQCDSHRSGHCCATSVGSPRIMERKYTIVTCDDGECLLVMYRKCETVHRSWKVGKQFGVVFSIIAAATKTSLCTLQTQPSSSNPFCPIWCSPSEEKSIRSSHAPTESSEQRQLQASKREMRMTAKISRYIAMICISHVQ